MAVLVFDLSSHRVVCVSCDRVWVVFLFGMSPCVIDELGYNIITLAFKPPSQCLSTSP
jgi:hypothetical protein